VLTPITVVPKPKPSAAVANSRMPNAMFGEDIKKLLSARRAIETRLLPRPSRNTRFKCQSLANVGARLEARMASIT